MVDPSFLHAFHPLVRHWFESRLGHPTTVQQRAWPLIANGDHVLITAPTGSGKTLAAFLWALDQLICGRINIGQTRILYISPLKALNNDVRHNLIRPLSQIRRLFERSGDYFPVIHVATRSGDTPPGERRRMIRRPPEILITTPESLHLMLSSQGGRSVLSGITTVILDEVHAVVGNKRGTLLMSAVDRLVPRCGEFQRIALSATIHPEEHVAAFVAGFVMQNSAGEPVYRPRPIRRCRIETQPTDIVCIRIPRALTHGDGSRHVWRDIAERLRTTVDAHRSTLIFTRSRRLCEKLTFLINADRSQPIAYAHHGSLSRSLRLDVERRLKAGSLKAIVATGSLELGIDIGSLDLVVLVASPASITSAIQRIGRSGHGVEQSSRAEFIATHAMDALTAMALSRAVVERDIEPVRAVSCPLDVLSQVMVSMTGMETWNADDLYHFLRTSHPFHDLKRKAFDLVVEMLTGRYAATRIAALQPKLAFDRTENTLAARKGALLGLYAAGGVIPDRGYFVLRHQESGARIGELDEEFVWEARQGQVFTLGTQNWRIERITHNDVFVRQARSTAPAPPFWRAEDVDQDHYLAEKIGRLLEYAQTHLSATGLIEHITAAYGLDEESARYLVNFLVRQQQHTGCALPHRHHLVVEQMPAQKGGAGIGQVVIHTFWGGRVNRPFALALQSAWEKRYGHAPSIFSTNAAVYLLPSQTVEPDAILSLVRVSAVETQLRESMEGSGVFGARFRECAARALLMPAKRFGQRMPLWISRQQSQRLLDAVGRFDDFPIVLEAWRTCLNDDFDLPALRRVLEELASGEIKWSAVNTASPSPMALSGSWRLINQYMYADDRQPGKTKTRLSRDLINDLILNPELRPTVDEGAVDEFVKKRQRVYHGYAPDSPMELLEWVKERVLMPWTEWQTLLRQMHSQRDGTEIDVCDAIAEKLVRLIPGRQVAPDDHLIAAREMAPGIAGALYGSRPDICWMDLNGTPVSIGRSKDADKTAYSRATDLVSQWLRFYGPVTADFIAGRLKVDPSWLTRILAVLVDDRALVSGRLLEGSTDGRVCHADNFESLLRLRRKRRMVAIEPREPGALASLLARFQGIIGRNRMPDALADRLQSLMGLPLPATIWETDILPARLEPYDPRQMDSLMQATSMMWIGSEGRNIAFCMEADLDLIVDTAPQPVTREKESQRTCADIERLFGDPAGRYPLSALLGDPPRPLQTVLDQLWAAVWQGRVTNDAMTTLRRESAGKNTVHGASQAIPARGRRAMRRFRRNRTGLPESLAAATMGNWRLIRRPPPPDGLLEVEETVKDRVRLLMDRYGILFRQLLEREPPLFRWPAIFRALRLMELSGEITAGYFFMDIPGPQFAAPPMLKLLHDKKPETDVYWMSAMDPACLCGLKIDVLKGQLPRRIATTHLVYRGNELAMVSRRSGRILDIRLPAEHPQLPDCLDLFEHLLERAISPLRAITIESINGETAVKSPFLNLFRQRFDTSLEKSALTLYRRLTP